MLKLEIKVVKGDQVLIHENVTSESVPEKAIKLLEWVSGTELTIKRLD